MYPPKRIFFNSDGNNENDSQKEQKSSYKLKIKNEAIENINNNKEIQNEKNIFCSNNINYYNNIYSLNNKKCIENKIKKDIGIKRKRTRGKDNYIIYIKNKRNEILNRPNEKQNFKWFSYIKYMVLCGKNNPKISYYVDFRTKLISEENIIQNYIDIYKLLDVNKIKK